MPVKEKKLTFSKGHSPSTGTRRREREGEGVSEPLRTVGVKSEAEAISGSRLETRSRVRLAFYVRAKSLPAVNFLRKVMRAGRSRIFYFKPVFSSRGKMKLEEARKTRAQATSIVAGETEGRVQGQLQRTLLGPQAGRRRGAFTTGFQSTKAWGALRNLGLGEENIMVLQRDSSA